MRTMIWFSFLLVIANFPVKGLAGKPDGILRPARNSSRGEKFDNVYGSLKKQTFQVRKKGKNKVRVEWHDLKRTLRRK